jgi:hypothetical protein
MFDSSSKSQDKNDLEAAGGLNLALPEVDDRLASIGDCMIEEGDSDTVYHSLFQVRSFSLSFK